MLWVISNAPAWLFDQTSSRKPCILVRVIGRVVGIRVLGGGSLVYGNGRYSAFGG
jgi:hypothetical protein